MRTRNEKGFTLIELLIVIAIIGIIAAIAVPGLIRARQSGNEASGMANMRTIHSAETNYAATCGGGGYATTLADLGKAPASGGPPFIPADLVAGTKSGYTVTLAGVGATVLAAASTCNASAAASTTEFFTETHPVTLGSTGQRSFGTDERGTIYFDPAGSTMTTANFNTFTILQ